MRRRWLRELEVSAVGLGAMGFSHGYGKGPGSDEAVSLLRRAHDLGCTFFDTAEGYGDGHNEQLVGRALRPIRDEVVVATKFRLDGRATDEEVAPMIRRHLDASLRRLGTDRIDLYYQHRVPDWSVEAVAAAMGDLITDGKILGWGQSQSTEAQVRRAHAITPLSAVQSEYSLMERMFEQDVLPACKELGIGFVSFSPLASGLLSGSTGPGNSYTGDDVRRAISRFQDDNVAANQPLLDVLRRFEKQKQATPAQVSLAWMLHKWPFVVPIPGMRSTARIEENLSAADVELTDAEFTDMETELSHITIYGNRTDEDIAKLRSMP